MKEGKHVPATPDDIRAMRQYIDEHRTAATPFDIVWEGTTPGDDQKHAKAIVQSWADAGATWWNEAAWEEKDIGKVRARIRQGPPRID
jgi:hypothetical protein